VAIWNPRAARRTGFTIVSLNGPFDSYRRQCAMRRSLPTVTSAVTPSARQRQQRGVERALRRFEPQRRLEDLAHAGERHDRIGTTCTGTAARSGISAAEFAQLLRRRHRVGFSCTNASAARRHRCRQADRCRRLDRGWRTSASSITIG